MKVKKTYVCECCNQGYSEKEDALNCENAHIKIKEIKAVEYGGQEKYPSTVSFVMEDGEILNFYSEDRRNPWAL